VRSIDEGLKDLLAGDAQLMAIVTGGIWRSPAPDGTAYPYLTFVSLGGPHRYTWGRRMLRDLRYQIRIVGIGQSSLVLKDALERVDVLLMDHELVPGETMYLRRESDLPDATAIDQGVPLPQVGAVYSVMMR
jgi:hypothetical protein